MKFSGWLLNSARHGDTVVNSGVGVSVVDVGAVDMGGGVKRYGAPIAPTTIANMIIARTIRNLVLILIHLYSCLGESRYGFVEEEGSGNNVYAKCEYVE